MRIKPCATVRGTKAINPWHHILNNLLKFCVSSQVALANCTIRCSTDQRGSKPVEFQHFSSSLWKMRIFKLRINYVKLRRSLRISMGCLRGFHGFSTPTGFFTGFLRPITWFSNPAVKTAPKVCSRAPNFVELQFLRKTASICFR